MREITKKRLKAKIIDDVIASAVSFTAEYFLRKKIKNEAFHALVTPLVTQYTLEYVQMKCTGQTAGYRIMSLRLEDEAGGALTDKQILKRIAYRDTWSTFKYLQDRDSFEQQDGAVLPHDTVAGTTVTETVK